MFAEIFQDSSSYTVDEVNIFNELVTLYEGKIHNEFLVQTLSLYLSKYPSNPYFNYLQGHILYDQNFYQEALKHFDYFIEKGFYQGYFQKALCYQQLKDYSQALILYNEAIKRISYFEKNEHPFIKFRNWVFPSKAQILNNRAVVNYNLGRSREAIEDCTVAIKYEPQYGNPYSCRAGIYNSIEKPDAAIEDFKMARIFSSNLHHNIDFLQGFAEERANDFFPAIKDLAENMASDSETQRVAFEFDIKEKLQQIISSLRDDNATATQKYDTFLALAVAYVSTFWPTVKSINKTDLMLGLACYNVAYVIAKYESKINHYEFFVDITMLTHNEI